MIRPNTEKKWVWDCQENRLVQRIEVSIQVIGSLGNVFDEEGPLLASNGQEVFEAVSILKERLGNRIAKEYSQSVDGSIDP